MIIVELFGGLGNQLYQYALGRKLSILNNELLKLDISFYRIQQHRKYCLKYFNIVENIASENEIAALKNSTIRHENREISAYIQEKSLEFDKETLAFSGNVYLSGYWQSYKYFKDVKEILKNEISLKQESDSKNIEMANKIKSCEAISLHIRRGDFLGIDNAKVNEIYSLEYHYNAADKISASIKNPHFFVFSDDMQWVKKNFKLKYDMTFVDINNDNKNYEDLNLMSLCKHHIIVNSTFSWWGAWLGENADKIVIAPKRWSKCTYTNTDDLLPESWIKL